MSEHIRLFTLLFLYYSSSLQEEYNKENDKAKGFRGGFHDPIGSFRREVVYKNETFN